jgi:signal transduction histidine kinase
MQSSLNTAPAHGMAVMPQNTARKTAFFIVLAMAVLLCIIGIKQSAEKATLGPPDILVPHTRGGGIGVSQSTRGMHRGDQLVAINDVELHHLNDVEFILDGKRIGETVEFTLRRDGEEIRHQLMLLPYYSRFDTGVQILTAFSCLLIGLFVLANRPRDAIALRFFCISTSIACLVSCTNGYYNTEALGSGYILRMIFPSMFVWTGAFLVDFSIRFTSPETRPGRITVWLPYFLPAAATIAGIVTGIRAISSQHLPAAVPYYLTLSLSKGLLILLALTAVGIAVRKFFITRDRVLRLRILWVFSSVAFSVCWYVFFWQLPTSIIIRNTLPVQYHSALDILIFPESGVLVALVISCVTLAIGIIRFRLFNIEVIVRQGMITFATVMALISVYVLSVYILWNSADMSSPTTVLMWITGLLAFMLLAVLPIRGIARYLIDRYLFRIEQHYRKAQRQLYSSIQQCLSVEQVTQLLSKDMTALLRCDRSLLLLRHSEGHFMVHAERGMRIHAGSTFAVHAHRFTGLTETVYDTDSYSEPGAGAAELDLCIARKCGLAVIALLRGQADPVEGIIALGKKTGFAPFSVEDVELINEAATLAMAQIQRIRLQERLTIQLHETERLRELNRMKSHFVSGISHDLKTPLTSIRLYAEMISMRLSSSEPALTNMFGIIDGECVRLSRLIDNVLDFSRIEQGKHAYRMQETDIVSLVSNTVQIMQHQFDITNIELRYVPQIENCTVVLDPSAIQSALINIISNAIKYSTDKRSVIIGVGRDRYGAWVNVQDFGQGIESGEMEHLFEAFYRSSREQIQRCGGAGLGLALVRHIATAHGAVIDIQSAPGNGSTVTIIFPQQEAA